MRERAAASQYTANRKAGQLRDPVPTDDLSLLKIPSDGKDAIRIDCDVFMRAPDLHREEPACSLLRADEAGRGWMCSSR